MRILLAVSGGIDSMYMLNRASELFPEASFAVANCNFSLRGEEADLDSQFVVNWCSEHGLQCFTRKFDTTEYAVRKGISIEMAARELRYAWFSELCSEEGFDAVAVAHNANDNAETLILNLLRGTGTKGIRGMSGSRILRPLLGISREEIRRWMEGHGCSWREDSTNSQGEYKRNRIRNSVFPIFESINPSFIRTLNEDMKRFAQVDDIAEDYFLSVRGAVLLEDGSISAKALMELKHWEYVLFRLLEDSGINAEQLQSLQEALKRGNYTGKVFGPVTGASGKLEIGKPAQRKDPVVEVIDRSQVPELKQPSGILIMDADKVPQPLKIRSWEEGDWMRPLGMRGKKKLSDLFVDLKWSLVRKESALVVELDGHHVAALLYERIDGSVRVTDSTKKIIRLS